jgi:hypothetical protein
VLVSVRIQFPGSFWPLGPTRPWPPVVFSGCRCFGFQRRQDPPIPVAGFRSVASRPWIRCVLADFPSDDSQPACLQSTQGFAAHSSFIVVSSSDLSCRHHFLSRRSVRTESSSVLLSLALGTQFVVASLFAAAVKFYSVFCLA